MNREIKFNVIYKDKVNWKTFNKTFTLDDLVAQDHFDEISDSPLLRDYEILVIRQLTWLKDKNWKEIYEGDVLQYKAMYPKDFQERCPHKKYNRIWNWVTYSIEYCAFMIDTTFKWEEIFCGFAEHKQWEIIWNIYESPNLLNNN